MNVEYWDVNNNSPTNLPFTSDHISAHLLADWIPSASPDLSTSILGWPRHFLCNVSVGGVDYLALNSELGYCERQWKGFLSWMVGVAGARHVLSTLNYRWIAPCSAFYPGIKTRVTTRWHAQFPAGRLQILYVVPPTSKLRPDFIALKASSSGCPTEFCIAEAKGADKSLKSLHACPQPWKNQVVSVGVSIDGIPTAIPRRLVIASRVSPNAEQNSTRRIQIRAWNSQESIPGLAVEDSIPIVVAALVGLYRNLGMNRIAFYLLSSARRIGRLPIDGERVRGGYTRSEYQRMKFDLQETERLGDEFILPSISLQFGGHSVEARIAPATRHLTASLLVARDRSEAAAAIVRADQALNEWQDRDWQGAIALPIGVSIHPRER